MAESNPAGYNEPGTTESAAGLQIRTDFYQKKALIEVQKKQFFSPMADVTAMPKHFGKKIKRFHYLPLLNDANINDQGIDASGIATAMEKTILIYQGSHSNAEHQYFAVGSGANAGAASTAAQAEAVAIFTKLGLFDTNYAGSVTKANAAGWTVDASTAAVPQTGNLYGSSKDVGTISGKLPALSEHGGRVNRVGFKRVELEGSIEKFGFFDEYTQESVDFDTDAGLRMHINREMLYGASEITEDALQIDLLNGAGVIRFAGAATKNSEVDAESNPICEVTYNDLMRLSIDLDNNRSPKYTTMITGTRLIDTKVIDSARALFIGSELIPTIKAMVDLHDNPAFIGVQHYAAGATVMQGEIGTVDQFRIVVVPEMMHFAGAGADVGTNPGYRATGTKYDVFPMLCIGSESFTTIGFQTDGKTVKFKITHKPPGNETADRTDPYGETGFMSIKWYYGTMILRPERLALIKTVARL